MYHSTTTRFVLVCLCCIALATGILPAQWQATDGIFHTDISCIYTRESMAVIGTEKGIYRLNDESNTWISVASSSRISGFASSDSVLFAAIQEGGILASDDNGVSWNRVDVNFPQEGLVILIYKDGLLFA